MFSVFFKFVLMAMLVSCTFTKKIVRWSIVAKVEVSVSRDYVSGKTQDAFVGETKRTRSKEPSSRSKMRT